VWYIKEVYSVFLCTLPPDVARERTGGGEKAKQTPSSGELHCRAQRTLLGAMHRYKIRVSGCILVLSRAPVL
jgi:hypothetical protein